MAKTIQDFENEARAAGLLIRTLVTNSPRIQRVPTDDKLKRKNGWYILREDTTGLHGAYGNWGMGFKATFSSRDWQTLSPPDMELRRAQQREWLVELARLQAEAAERAGADIEDLPDADPTHPYLIRKSIKPHGALQKGDLLVLPLINADGEVTTYQTIAPNGDKRFLKDAKKQGSFHVIGQDVPTIICEGFSTGASIHEATGETVAVAIDAGNINHVLRVFSGAVVAGDNDEAGRGAVPHGAPAVYPSGGFKDFNDLYAAEGLEAVAKCFLPHGPEQDDTPPGAMPEIDDWGTDSPYNLPDTRDYTPPVNKLYYIRAADMQPNLESRDFVQGLLEDEKISVVYGESNCGKTFWTTDLCYHVASGRSWRDLRVEQGGILYLALEGASGLVNRMAVLKKRYDFMPENFLVMPCPINLLDEAGDIDALMALIEQAMVEVGGIRWIVIDTLARAIAGADENSGQDMGRLVAAADRIRAATKAHITFIHHSGKDKAKGARGHSSLRAAVDTEIEISRDPDAIFSNVKIVKQRDLPMGPDMQFTLQSISLGENRHGEPVSSCIVEPFEAVQRASTADLTPTSRFIYDAIKMEAGLNGKALVVNGMQYRSISYDALGERLDALGWKELYKPDGELKPIRTLTSAARVGLKRRKMIDFDKDSIWVSE